MQASDHAIAARIAYRQALTKVTTASMVVAGQDVPMVLIVILFYALRLYTTSNTPCWYQGVVVLVATVLHVFRHSTELWYDYSQLATMRTRAEHTEKVR